MSIVDTFKERFDFCDRSGRLINRTNGKEAGFDNGNGYRRVGVLGKQYYSHQIIVALFIGDLTRKEIDHIDGDTTNNRLSNLRLTDRFGNMQNSPKRSHSRQPYKGVRFKNGAWSVRITANKQPMEFGKFKSAEEAHEEYKRAALTLHGEYARSA